MAIEPTVRDLELRLTAVTVGILVVGHLALLIVLPARPGLPVLVALEIGGLVVVAGSELLAGLGTRPLVSLLLCYTIFVGGSWVLLSVTDSLVVSTLGLVIVAGVVTYGLHRYELVALGLVEG